jgi:DNA (cytosine-5)-methyltransferase 1
MNELALFAGAGGGILGGHLLGWRTVCAVEWEAYPASVLVARQNDKILPPFPIWDDVQTFDGKPWRGIVDVVSGGFPCQDISAAGKGTGITGARSSMWGHMARIIGEVRPRYVFVENSPMLTSRGLGTVLRDLAKLGYNAEWGVLGADDVGANHHRKRIWILAYSNSYGNIRSQPTSNGIQNQAKRESRTPNSSTRQSCGTSNVFRTDSMQRHEKSNLLANTNLCRCIHSQFEIDTTKTRFNALSNTSSSSKNVGNSESTGFSSCELGQRKIESWRTSSRNSQWWASEPNVDRVADGVAGRVDRLKAIGNGQVPLCAATAWNILKGRIDDKS